MVIAVLTSSKPTSPPILAPDHSVNCNIPIGAQCPHPNLIGSNGFPFDVRIAIHDDAALLAGRLILPPAWMAMVPASELRLISFRKDVDILCAVDLNPPFIMKGHVILEIFVVAAFALHSDANLFRAKHDFLPARPEIPDIGVANLQCLLPLVILVLNLGAPAHGTENIGILFIVGRKIEKYRIV